MLASITCIIQQPLFLNITGQSLSDHYRADFDSAGDRPHLAPLANWRAEPHMAESGADGGAAVLWGRLVHVSMRPEKCQDL